MAAGAALSLSLGWLAIRGTNWEEVRDALSASSPLMVAVAVALVLVSAWVRAVRWRLLWVKEKVSALRLFWIENAALGVNNFSPIRAMDEALEFGILTLRDRLPGSSVVATMMMCRVQDLAFTLLAITVATATTPVLLRLAPAIVPLSLLFVGWLAIIASLGRIVNRFPRLGRISAVASFAHAVDTLWSRKRRLAVTFSVTGTYWLLLGPAGWAVARSAGIELTFQQAMVTVLGAIFFATALPGLPGAVGTFEFAAVALMELWGVTRESAVTFSIILHAVLFLPPMVFSVVVLPREGLGSIRAFREMRQRALQARAVPPSSEDGT